MKSRRLVAVCIALMLALGSFTCAYGVESAKDTLISIYVFVVDEDRQPVKGVIMDLHGCGDVWSQTTDENGQVLYLVPPGEWYEIQEMGYVDEGIAYNKLSFKLTWKMKKDAFSGDAEYELDEIGRITWIKGDYENRTAVRVEVDVDRYNGSRLEMIDDAGNCVGVWSLKDDGELIANVQPGAYTLREIVELNGYEIPVNSHIMVGSGNLVPVKPPETVEPETTFEPELDPLPSYYYDEFQKWLDGLK